MKTRSRAGTWIAAALIAATSAAACSDKAERRASDAAEDVRDASRDAARDVSDASKDAARAVKDAATDVGRAADAAVETVDVKTALMADPRVNAGGINVDSDRETKTVTLKGHVPTNEQRVIAEQVAVAKAVGYRVRMN